MTTLSIEEQKKSLSKGQKKQKHGPPAKMVLFNPFGNYWPELCLDDSETLKKEFASVLIKEQKKPSLPWRKLIKFPKPVRKLQIQELTKNIPISDQLVYQRKNIKLGLNAVSRAIQNSKISSCVLAGDMEPNVITKSVVALASAKNIPVVVMPEFKKITCELLGFSCSALGIVVDSCGKENSSYKNLNDLIIEYSFKFAKSSNYTCNKQAEDKNEEKILYNIGEKEVKSIETEPANIYLYRDSNSKRVFVPPSEMKISTKSFCLSSDFIPLNFNSSDEIQYVPPVIKRSESNPKRLNKKRKFKE